MAVHSVSRGLDLPISGAPVQHIEAARASDQVALLPSDLPSIRPRLLVQVGDEVRAGQAIYEDRKQAAIKVVAPAAGKITAVHRGERRVIQSIEIAVSPVSRAGEGESPFSTWRPDVGGDGKALRALLLESGLWTAFRTRPFSRTPLPDTVPHAVFVTAMDTAPLAPDVDVIVADRQADFDAGLAALRALTDAPLFVCRRAGSTAGDGVSGVRTADFAGKHPAGTVGYHIHTLAPVSREHVVWHLGAQDVIRIGALVRTGHLDATQVVALGGPQVTSPRLLRTVLGTHVPTLVAGELNAEHDTSRVISGSVLTGRQIADSETAYLGRFDQIVSVIPESSKSDFLGWVNPLSKSFTFLPAFVGLWKGARDRAFDTRTHGGRRAMVPIGVFEQVMPMDLMPTHLLRALTVGDVEWAEELGALELDEEDVALCSFVCPGKYEYGTALRHVLDQIAAE